MVAAGSSEAERASPNGECLGAGEVLAHLRGRVDRREPGAVRGHLDRCAGCRLLVAEAARATNPAGGTDRRPRTLDDGERIGARYEVRRFIAKGGMGEVYEAFDLELGEPVALKTLVVTATDQIEATQRLLAEVRIARKVTHPNVCRILEFGKHQRPGAGEIPFLTMPLLKGETLAARLARGGRLPPADCLRILRELARGLDAVHAEGIVHRDFKSENVFMLQAEGGTEKVLVMDFGLARALELQGARSAASGQLVLGTPAYMAPEQVQGRSVTRVADVFAFGVVAFEMLTGRRPFGGDSPTGIALARLTTQARRPSSLIAGLDRRWDELIGRCLKLEPRQRFATMAEITAVLDRLARNPSAWLRPRRAALLVAIGLAGVVVAGVAVMRRRDDAPPSLAPTIPVAASAPSSADPRPSRREPVPPPQIRKRARTEKRPRVLASDSKPSGGQPSEQPMPTELAPPQARRARNGDDLVDPF